MTASTRSVEQENAMPRPFGVLIKPTSSRCNLNCAYCFYLEKQALYPWRTHPTLSLDTFQRFLEQYATLSAPSLSFAWQGGEPTLMGLDFFREVMARQVQLKLIQPRPPGGIWNISNALQTNGTLLDDDWAAFFKAWNFLIGVSLDGPPDWHDANRLDRAGHATHERVLHGIACLRHRQVDFNVLTVVNPSNVGRPRELLHYLVRQGFTYLQFIPCVETALGHVPGDGAYAPWSISAAEYGTFLNEIFDEWLRIGFRNVRIRLFDSLVQTLVGMPPDYCQIAPSCGDYLVLEHNGDLYPCDFFVEPGWKLGNVHEQSLQEILAEGKLGRFGQQKQRLHPRCLSCRWRPLCHGECPRYRVLRTGSAEGSLPVFCEAYEAFFAKSYRRLEQVAETVAQDLVASVTTPVQAVRQLQHSYAAAETALARAGNSGLPALAPPRATTAGRNEHCPCGSGKKNKRCCGS